MIKRILPWFSAKSTQQAEPDTVSWPKSRAKDTSSTRALLGAIALGLVFAFALTIAASWAPSSFAKHGPDHSLSSQLHGKTHVFRKPTTI